MRIYGPFLFWIGSVFALGGSMSVAMLMPLMASQDSAQRENAMIMVFASAFAAIFGAVMMGIGISPKE